MSTDRLKVALRGSEDRESQLRADLATSQESAEKERKSAEELKKRLEEAIQGVELQTPSGPLSTGNSAAVQAFLDGQSSRIAVLERKVESSHREREEETTRLKTLLEATKTQSELTMSQLVTVKTQLATTKVTLESVEGKLRDKEQEVSELPGRWRSTGGVVAGDIAKGGGDTADDAGGHGEKSAGDEGEVGGSEDGDSETRSVHRVLASSK